MIVRRAIGDDNDPGVRGENKYYPDLVEGISKKD
jgi:hypothetical protein